MCKIYRTIFFLLFLISNDLIGQEYFIKRIDPYEDPSVERIQSLVKNGDRLIAGVKRICPGDFHRCINITEFDQSGQIVFEHTVDHYGDNQNILLDQDTVILTATPSFYSDTIIAQKRGLNGVLVAQKSYFEPFDNYRVINPERMIEYNDQNILSGTLELLEDPFMYHGFLLYLNRDLSLDSLVILDDYFFNNVYDLSIGPDSLLTIFIQVKIEDENGFKLPYRCIYKYDEKKERVYEWCPEEYENHQARKTGIVTPEGLHIFNNGGSRDNQLWAVNEEEVVLWKRDSGSGSYHERYTSLYECANGDILSVGNYYGANSHSLHPYLIRLNTEGNVLWERTYLDYAHKDTFIKAAFFTDVLEQKDGSIVAGGGVDTMIEYNGQMQKLGKMLLAKVDRYGCIEEDKCNEYLVYARKSDSLYFYDQIDTRTKKWFYSVKNPDGSRQIMETNFNEDTLMYVEEYGTYSLYRHYNKSLDNGAFTTDTFKIRYKHEGVVMYMHHRNYIECCNYTECCQPGNYDIDSVLYDFRLKIGDNFKLPHNFGTATVSSIDSVFLYDGYPRKRLILNHNNPDNQLKFGDLIWIEGIGSPNGMFYFYDWIYGTKTTLNCYFDRDRKRFGEAEDCYDLFTGLEEVPYENDGWDVSVYPNPSSDKVNIVSKKAIEQITIYNSLGQVELVSDHNSEIDISFLTQGLKFVRIQGEGRSMNSISFLIM